MSAGGFLILREQRRARPESPPAAREAAETPEAAGIAQSDLAGSVEPPPEESDEATIEEPGHPAYLFSSKSAAITPLEDVPDGAATPFLGSSKSLAPLEVAPSPSPYLSTSKSMAIELVEEPLEDAAEEQAAADHGPPSKP